MKNRILSLGLVFLFLALCGAPTAVTAVGFDDYYKEYTKLQKAVALVVGSPNAANKMAKVQIDPENSNVMPLIMESRTLVPLRFIATAFNAQVGWDPDTAGISIRHLDTKIEMTLNDPVINVNGQQQTLEVAPVSIESRTMVPLRAVSEALSKQVFWDPKGLIVLSEQADILNVQADSGFIDTLIAAIQSDGAIVPPVFGGIFDQKPVKEIVDFDQVEDPYYIRDGLPNVAQKLLGKQKVKVAYIGGSITEMSGYRDKTEAWFKTTYKDASFEFLNAGVGGTGSNFGAVRLGTDVLSFRPDLLFVEFAVNDASAGELDIIKNMEGIVRQCWADNPNMDLIFVYTLQASDVKTAAEGKYSRTAKLQDYVAQHYGIPSIFMGYEVAEKAAKKELIFNSSNPGDAAGPAFSSDGVHPNNEGSELYFAMLKKAFAEIFALPVPEGPFAHETKDILYSQNMGQLKTYAPEKAKLSAGFVKADSASSQFKPIWGWRADYAYSATKAGESVTIRFNGTQAGIFYLPGPDAPCVDVIVDGTKIKEMSLFDPYHGVTGYYVGYYLTPVLEEGEHTVTFQVNDTKADKIQIIKASNYNVTNSIRFLEANRDWFDGTNFIVGKVLVNGELLP